MFYKVLAHISRVAEHASDIHLHILKRTSKKPNAEKRALYKQRAKEFKIEGRVKPFSITPVWKLQPCFMQYSSTCIKAAFQGYGDVDSFIKK